MNKFLIFFILLFTANSIYATSFEQKKEITTSIYQKIASVAKDNRLQPTLNFLANENGTPNYQAFFSPNKHTINIGEGIYDLAQTLGADSLNAMALVLGHELAHFYKDHSWSMDFGIKNADTKIGQNVQLAAKTKEESAKLETQADYFGGLFGCLAGYNTLGVSRTFFEKYYQATGIPANLPGYPTKEERQIIAKNTQMELQQLVPVFQAANYLATIGEYDKAATCYHRILKKFPGRTVHNNMGAALALEAIHLFEAEDIQYLYPIGLDFNTRLKKPRRTTKGSDGKESCYRLLAEARDHFQQAIDVDGSYIQAHINLALVETLLNEPEMGIAFAKKAQKLAKATKKKTLWVNAHIALGLAYAKNGELVEAKTAFEKAQKRNPTIAQTNLAILAGTLEHAYATKATAPTASANESINELDLSLIELVIEEAESIRIKRQNEESPNTLVQWLANRDYQVVVVTAYSTPKSVVHFIKTPPKYRGQTTKGIKIGMSQRTLEEKYGQANDIITATNGQLWVYSYDKLVFFINSKGFVKGWMIYG